MALEPRIIYGVKYVPCPSCGLRHCTDGFICRSCSGKNREKKKKELPKSGSVSAGTQ